MGGELSRSQLESACDDKLQVIPGRPNLQLSHKFADVEKSVKKASSNDMADKLVMSGLRQLGELLKKSDGLKAGSPCAGALFGPAGFIFLYMVDEIEKGVKPVHDDAWVLDLARKACNSLIADSCDHENAAIMDHLLKNLLVFEDEERTDALRRAHDHLGCHIGKLGRHIQDYADKKHLALFEKWITSAKLHISVVEELAQGSSMWATRRDTVIQDYRNWFNYLAEGFIRRRTFAIVGSYSHAHPRRPLYDCLGDEDEYGTTLMHITDKVEGHGQAHTICRCRLRAMVIELLLPHALDFNRGQTEAQCENVLLSYVPDDEIGDFYGPFTNLFKGNWTTTAKDTAPLVHKLQCPA